MRVGFINDLAIKMEIDYVWGGIKILYKNNMQNLLTRFLICIECLYENTTKGGIKTHLAKNTTNYNYILTSIVHIAQNRILT